MKLLKNRRAWLKWKREEMTCQDPVSEPTSFPCFAYTTLRSYGYEELNENYLYPNDIATMHGNIQEALMIEKVDRLSEALGDKQDLTKGAALEVENLDVSKLGLWTPEQKADLLAKGIEDDFFPAEEILGRLGMGYFARRSDGGTKWHTHLDTKIKLHKDLVKK